VEHQAKVFEVHEDLQKSAGLMRLVGGDKDPAKVAPGDYKPGMLRLVGELWDTVEEVNGFINTASEQLWAEVEPEALEDGSKALMKKVRSAPKDVRDIGDCYSSLLAKVKEFSVTPPLVKELRQPYMRPRHWQALMDATGMRFSSPDDNPQLQLFTIIKLKLYNHQEAVEEITESAAKESKMEDTLLKLEAFWAMCQYTSTMHKPTKVPLLKVEDDDFEQLEGDVLAVQGMLASRFVDYFRKQVDMWQQVLGSIAKVTTLLAELQRTWSYLQPLFASADVQIELPQAAEAFGGVDGQMRVVLQDAWEAKLVRTACEREGLLQELQQIHEGMDGCKKALMEFLDGKRRLFPRFFFVSEADLLDILSNGSNPRKILKHTQKVFICTKTLALSDPPPPARPDAFEFEAGIGHEHLSFVPSVQLRGKVEEYLHSVLAAMTNALYENMLSAYDGYKKKRREVWLLDRATDGKKNSLYAAQINLLIAGVKYAEEVEQAFKAIKVGQPTALDRSLAKIRDQLNDLIKKTRGALDKPSRMKVMVLITMDAHSRDVVERMVRENVTTAAHFIWQSQLKLRYAPKVNVKQQDGRDVLELPGAMPAPAGLYTKGLETKKGGVAYVQICDAILPYGFEYLGHGPRLVVTPLTDRIYVTATQALNLHMGCAPAGPAGTGKTETTKDLANALGVVCYVFNCSPEMDYKSLGNIFKGLASSGAWGCFDEFNRLIPEVLSVCSVQFKAVCDALKIYEAPGVNDRFVCEGDEIELIPTCGAFITMNPGYLGRAELPEGLKALFRPMTVMVPDLVLICENMMMAEGFEEAKDLASKFFGLYSLLSELLSKQEHYDWGLRAVKSVLVVAGAFKRAAPKATEADVLLRALRDFNTPKIVKQDEVVFFGLLGDLFPGVDPPRNVDPVLQSAVEQACEVMALTQAEPFMLKIVQLHELLDIRHCVFIMGPAAAGKSTCWRALQRAREVETVVPTKKGAAPPKDPLEPFRGTTVVDLNPKAVSTEELYGCINLKTREWKDGLLSTILRDLGEIKDEKPKWIVLDGDLDANWIESMNSVMDDNRMLTLASNERIPLKPHMRMIFEIRDLKYATPATVSRAGILYISAPTGTGDGDGAWQWRALIEAWLQRDYFGSAGVSGSAEGGEGDAAAEGAGAGATRGLLHIANEAKSKLRECFDLYVPACLRYSSRELKHVVPVQESTLVQQLLWMLDCALTDAVVTDLKALELTFAFCAVWAFGAALTISDDGTDYRKMFSDWWRSEFKKVKIPSRDTIFHYFLDPSTMKFEPWTAAPQFSVVPYDSSTTPMSEVTVPTTETASVAFWAEKLIQHRQQPQGSEDSQPGRPCPLMFCGQAGTGKTQQVKGILKSLNNGGKEGATFTSTTINFSFYTHGAALQTTIEGQLVKTTGNHFAPAGGGGTQLVLFVDDINLPEVDAYNTQSAVAFLRQHVDYNHWYDRAKLSLKEVSDCQYIACMNPTAGSFIVNPRLQRHFCTFAIGMPSGASLLQIYQTFLQGHLLTRAPGQGSFDEGVQKLLAKVISGTLSVHTDVTKTFRKTAAHFHYEFNMRHLANVFQGLLIAQPAQFGGTGEEGGNGDAAGTAAAGSGAAPQKFVELWMHELHRVYADRLVSYTDVNKFTTLALATAKKQFPSYSIARFFAQQDPAPLIFCHFVDTWTETVDHKKYDQVTDMESVRGVCYNALEAYNESHPAMPLVLFDDAVGHICRIVRIIMNPSGHALLVGVGGSGKQSLAKLAAFICDFSVSQIVISATYGMMDFKADMQSMFRQAGVKGSDTMFLFTDAQITDERFLVYVNDLLASGNIPDLYTADEKDGIIGEVTNKCKAWQKSRGIVLDLSPGAVMEYYISQIRAHLHCCMCFSPVGEAFKSRARKFPALVNCTVIDWFQPWPEEALYNVGKKFLADPSFTAFNQSVAIVGNPALATVISEESTKGGGEGKGEEAEGAEGAEAGNNGNQIGELVRQGVEEFLPWSFESVNRMAAEFEHQERRRVHTTPKSYLELLAFYKRLLTSKTEETDKAVTRLASGLLKLKETAGSTQKLEEELAVALVAAQEKMAVSEVAAVNVDRQKAIVERDTEEANVEKQKCEEIANIVADKQAATEQDLLQAEPAVQAAEQALDTLDVSDLQKCKTMNVPPMGVDDVFAAVMTLVAGVHGIGKDIKRDNKGVVKESDWKTAKKILLKDVKVFMVELKSFKAKIDGKEVEDKAFKACKNFTSLSHFNYASIVTKSSAAAGLCSFVLNICEYYRILQEVEPKRRALDEANVQLDEAKGTLHKVIAKVEGLQAELDTLTAELDAANLSKAEAEAAVAKGQLKLGLAGRLTTSLASENIRWAVNVRKLEANKTLLVGDVLLAAAFVSYIGPFTKPFRDRLLAEEWRPRLENVPHTGDSGAAQRRALFAAAPTSEAGGGMEGEEGAAANGGGGEVAGGAEEDQEEEGGGFDPLAVLTSSSEVATWHTQGLPSDRVSAENGAIASCSDRWPLLIDPQLQGVIWVKEKESAVERELKVVRLGQPKLLHVMELAICMGHSVLIENIGESIDAALWPVISRACTMKGGRKHLALGDTEVEYHPDFRLFLHTKLGNPHFPPEIQAECTLINFTVTPSGLEDQLLGLVVAKERPELSERNKELVHQQNHFKIRVIEIEDDILRRLASAEGDITDDVALIEGLESSKAIADDIAAKSASGKRTQALIAKTSAKYRPVAQLGSLLFFAMMSLSQVHSYYLYSLNSFVVIFQRGVELVPKKAKKGGLFAKAGKAKGAMARLRNAAQRVVVSQRFHWNIDLLQAHRMPTSGGKQVNLAALFTGGGLAKKDEDADLGLNNVSDEELLARSLTLKKSVRQTVFDYIRRGLFERDKATVATLLALQILQSEGLLKREEVAALVHQHPPAEDPDDMGTDLQEWLPESAWARVKALELEVPELRRLGEDMKSDADDWSDWYAQAQPEVMPVAAVRKASISEESAEKADEGGADGADKDSDKQGALPLPGDYEEVLPRLAVARLCMIKALRPDRLLAALLNWVSGNMGDGFVTQPPFDMQSTYHESSCATPILFVLFPGVDPTPWVEGFAATLDITSANGRFANMSMGQGQEAPAEAMIDSFAKAGSWLLLQNVHLMQSGGWLIQLERKLELVTSATDTNPDFRCYLSAEAPPTPNMSNMPESLLQSCIKVANEAPSDVKSNLRRAWAMFDESSIDECLKPDEFASCLFALCFFHAVVLGRRRFGAQGWSRPYSFNNGDLTICANVLKSYLSASHKQRNTANGGVPWADLRYIFGEIMYGGHITDAWDRRTCNAYLDQFFKVALLEGMELAPGFPTLSVADIALKAKFAEDDDDDDEDGFQRYREYLEHMNENIPPESPTLFGLHANAETGYLVAQADTVIATVLLIGVGPPVGAGAEDVDEDGGDGESRGGGGKSSGGASDLMFTIKDLHGKCPKLYDMAGLADDAEGEEGEGPIHGPQSPHVVCCLQECERMNVLLGVIMSSLTELRKGLMGQLSMSDSMEQMASALTIGQVPGRNPYHSSSWERYAWHSNKSLFAWFPDMIARAGQLKKWSGLFKSQPHAVLPFSLWLPGLFNPMAFVTAVMQVTARKTKTALNTMATDSHVTAFTDPELVRDYPPEGDGAYVHGLFLQGARW
jgi:dynein heavy chain